jgi:competence protein ComEA
MTADKLNRFWLLATFLLIFIIILGAIVIRIRFDKGQPISLTPVKTETIKGNISVEGAVNSPGLYPLRQNDTLETIIQASGGTDDAADVSRIRLYVPSTRESEQAQLIDLNRADAWLLSALPGIGNTRAQAIVDYRLQNGNFSDIHEITRVEGIGESIFEKIKPYITIAP